MKRGFRDRDQIQTKEGLFFTIVSNTHPDDRVLCYLKYIPNSFGKWGKRNRRYKRKLKHYTMNYLTETFDFLNENYPQYLFYSKVYNISFSSVPQNNILKHYRPEEGLSKLAKMPKLDSLQTKTVELTQLLAEKSNIPYNCFGVTGSILIDIHRIEISDIDLVVYGTNNSVTVKEALQSLLNEKKSCIKKLSGKDLAHWIESKIKLYHLNQDEANLIYKSKWNIGVFKDTLFSIHPVKVECELIERYGERIYKPIGIVEGKALVVDSSDAMFMPAIYVVDNVKIDKGSLVRDIREVTSYEGLYSDLAESGEEIAYRGKLEEVEDIRREETYYRILIGSTEAEGKDYIKPLLTHGQ